MPKKGQCVKIIDLPRCSDSFSKEFRRLAPGSRDGMLTQSPTSDIQCMLTRSDERDCREGVPRFHPPWRTNNMCYWLAECARKVCFVSTRQHHMLKIKMKYKATAIPRISPEVVPDRACIHPLTRIYLRWMYTAKPSLARKRKRVQDGVKIRTKNSRPQWMILPNGIHIYTDEIILRVPVLSVCLFCRLALDAAQRFHQVRKHHSNNHECVFECLLTSGVCTKEQTQEETHGEPAKSILKPQHL